jgi:hypothetical protein
MISDDEPMIIAHRALLNGPNKALENQPSSIEKAIELGFYVEIDVWSVNHKWFLGHDKPEILGFTKLFLIKLF